LRHKRSIGPYLAFLSVKYEVAPEKFFSALIKAAENKTGGKAMEAEVDDESNTVQFEVEIVKDGKIHDVLVDGITGKVLKVSLDDESKESTENEKE